MALCKEDFAFTSKKSSVIVSGHGQNPPSWNVFAHTAIRDIVKRDIVGFYSFWNRFVCIEVMEKAQVAQPMFFLRMGENPLGT